MYGKVVYGLNDASRSWYFRVFEVMQKLGMKGSKFDEAVFTYGFETISVIIMLHVDMLFFGSESFLKNVVAPFKKIFQKFS